MQAGEGLGRTERTDSAREWCVCVCEEEGEACMTLKQPGHKRTVVNFASRSGGQGSFF